MPKEHILQKSKKTGEKKPSSRVRFTEKPK